MVKMFWNSLAAPQKVKHRVTKWPKDSTSRQLPNRNENVCSHKNITLAAIFTTAKKWTQLSVHQLIKENQNVVYPYNEILFDNEMENNTDKHYQID